MKALILILCLAALMLAASAPPTSAHGGPTFPIAQDRRSGPFRLSVWADPDIGSALFYVILEDAAGRPFPGDAQVDVWVRPLAGHGPEVRYPAERRDLNGQTEYVAAVTEDTPGLWAVRAQARSSQGDGEATAQVKGRMVGLGSWEIALYIFPFAAVGLLFLKGMLSHRRLPGRRPTVPVEASKP